MSVSPMMGRRRSTNPYNLHGSIDTDSDDTGSVLVQEGSEEEDGLSDSDFENSGPYQHRLSRSSELICGNAQDDDIKFLRGSRLQRTTPPMVPPFHPPAKGELVTKEQWLCMSKRVKAEMICRTLKRDRSNLLLEFECDCNLVKRFDKFLNDSRLRRLIKDTELLKSEMKARRANYTVDAVEKWRRKINEHPEHREMQEPMYRKQVQVSGRRETREVPTLCTLMTFTLEKDNAGGAESDSMVILKCAYAYRQCFTKQLQSAFTKIPIPLEILVEEDIFGGVFWPYYETYTSGGVEKLVHPSAKAQGRRLALVAADDLEWGLCVSDLQLGVSYLLPQAYASAGECAMELVFKSDAVETLQPAIAEQTRALEELDEFGRNEKSWDELATLTKINYLTSCIDKSNPGAAGHGSVTEYPVFEGLSKLSVDDWQLGKIPAANTTVSRQRSTRRKAPTYATFEFFMCAGSCTYCRRHPEEAKTHPRHEDGKVLHVVETFRNPKIEPGKTTLASSAGCISKLTGGHQKIFNEHYTGLKSQIYDIMRELVVTRMVRPLENVTGGGRGQSRQDWRRLFDNTLEKNLPLRFTIPEVKWKDLEERKRRCGTSASQQKLLRERLAETANSQLRDLVAHDEHIPKVHFRLEAKCRRALNDGQNVHSTFSGEKSKLNAGGAVDFETSPGIAEQQSVQGRVRIMVKQIESRLNSGTDAVGPRGSSVRSARHKADNAASLMPALPLQQIVTVGSQQDVKAFTARGIAGERGSCNHQHSDMVSVGQRKSARSTRIARLVSEGNNALTEHIEDVTLDELQSIQGYMTVDIAVLDGEDRMRERLKKEMKLMQQ